MPKTSKEENQNEEDNSDATATDTTSTTPKKNRTGLHRGGWAKNDDDELTLSSATQSVCTKYNYLNAIFYVLNATFVFGLGVFGLLGVPTLAELTEKYRTLITPVSFAFSIWIVIYIVQGLFVLFQLGPSYRNLPIVQEGVKYWYTLVCINQIAWIISFVFEFITLSLLFIILILISLIGCLRSLSFNTPPGEGLIPYRSNSSYRSSASSAYTVMGRSWEYLIFRFPFYLHAGWITVAMLLNINTILVYKNVGAEGQLWGAIMSLSVLMGTAVGLIFHRTAPDYVVPSVLAYATAGIALEISNPTEYIMTTFEQHTIETIWATCVGITSLIVVLIILRIIISNCQRLRGGRGGDDDYDVEGGKYVNIERLKKGYV